MSTEGEEGMEPAVLENYQEVIESLRKEAQELHTFKDMFFEYHPMELAKDKNAIIKQKRDVVVAKFEAIDEAQIPTSERATFLFLKGRCYNIVPQYEPRALECLSKAVKLDPTLINAWNELGECYWKNLNLKEARACFEGALNQKRNRVTLRSLSILLRQDKTTTPKESTEVVLLSVEYAKEAVALDPKDGQSWSVLGNAYLCQFFLVAQHPATLKLALSAYGQAWLDPIAKGHPDLHYNKGMALKYGERYDEAIESFETASRLDPQWAPPKHELKELTSYLNYIDHLLKNKGKVKAKRIQQMVKAMDLSMFGQYQPGRSTTLGTRHVTLEHLKIADMVDGDNPNTVVMGSVVGSLQSENSVPFTFAILDESNVCVAVNVYNWADGRGVLIGDCVAIPEPKVATHKINTSLPDCIANESLYNFKSGDKTKKTDLIYDFRTIRVNDPTLLLVNGKNIGMDEYATTRVTSTYEAY